MRGGAGREAAGFDVVGPFFLRGDGDCSGASVGGGCFRVFWCRVVGGGVCCDHGLAHGVEEQCSSPRSEIVGKGEDLECCC